MRKRGFVSSVVESHNLIMHATLREPGQVLIGLTLNSTVFKGLLHEPGITNSGLLEASYRLEPYVLFKAYACKALHDSLFRSALLNVPRYMARRDLGPKISTRLTRRGY
jgi:hypothetical protein